jgi:hypothetical protein
MIANFIGNRVQFCGQDDFQAIENHFKRGWGRPEIHAAESKYNGEIFESVKPSGNFPAGVGM